MSWIYPDPFLNNIVVADKDIDGLNHANNACYVVWCEQAAWKHSEYLGLSVEDYRTLDKGMVLHKAEYQYFLPSQLGDTLVFATWLTKCDQKLRLERQFQATKAATGETVMRACWSLVCATLSTGKASRFPAKFLAAYGSRPLPIGRFDDKPQKLKDS